MTEIHKTYQRRGYLSRDGYGQLDRAMAECAVLYNAALQERRDAYRHPDKVGITYNQQQGQLTHIRSEDEYWGGVSVHISRGVLRRVERAFNSFFRRVKKGDTPGYPRFKSLRRWHTIEMAEVNPAMVRDGKVNVKGLPTIHLKQGGLPDSGQLKSLRITKRGRRVTVNMAYAEEATPLPPNNASVGIDMGITDRLTLSNGESIDHRLSDRAGIAEKQRRLARCVNGSREWRKRRAILANAQGRERIRNRNACHRITTAIVREYGHIAVEDLPITNMTASAKGTVDSPGKNVRAKSGLNREIQSQTWGMLREQLRYKAEWAGREFAVVPAQHTSQRCSQCGVIAAGNRSGKTYRCRGCGYEGDADVNAALNIMARGFGGWEYPAAVLDAA